MIISLKRTKIIFSGLFIFTCLNAQSLSNHELKQIKNEYESRREAAFELLRGKPLVREKIIPPIFSEGSDFSRHYSYSLMDFAFTCFWLGEQVDSANNALIENANYYINYPRAFTDKDSFYWATDEMCKMLEFYGSTGCHQPGLIRPDVEERIFYMMYQYSKMQSQIEKAEWRNSRTWFIDESENHHVQRFYAAWHFSKYLKDHPYYQNKVYDDGHTAAEHHKAWNAYIKEWIRERARKGLFVEIANDAYGLETLKGIYNFYEFGDPELQELSRMLLDLYWSAWAQEQIDNIRGGAKTRVYPYEATSGETVFQKMAWYYLGVGKINPPHNNLFTLITSNYRMPDVAMDIALDKKGKGDYTILQRRQGRAEKGYYTPPDYRLIEKGGLLRYSYATPDYIAGTLFCEALPYEEWAMISSQNRWSGIIFEGDPDARIFASCQTGQDNRRYNSIWSVQDKGAIIFHKLQDSIHSRGAHRFQLWISKAGLTSPIQHEGWIFTESKGTYTAIKSIGDFIIEETERGFWIVPNNPYDPIIVQVARKTDIKNRKDFYHKMLRTQISKTPNQIRYTSLEGVDLFLPLNYEGVPTVNNHVIDLHPIYVMKSPFINALFNSGIYKITKGNRELVLDFN